MTQSQQSFVSDTGAALEQAIALLQQKGLIIQKYMQKMACQQGRIEQLVQEIQRLNWQNREREYNEQLIRKVPLKDLIQQGFVQMIEIGGGDNQSGNNNNRGSGSSSRSIQVKGNTIINGYQQPKRLYVIKIMVDEQTQQILLTNTMHLLKDNYKNIHSQPLIFANKNIPLVDIENHHQNYVINKKQFVVNGIAGMKTNVNTNDQQSQQLIESYCQQVLRQVQQMKQKLMQQKQQTNEKLIKLREENLQLKQNIVGMEKSLIEMKQAHRLQIMVKEKKIDEVIEQSQGKLLELKQNSNKSQAYLMQQIRLRVMQINDINQGFRNQKNKYELQRQEKDRLIQEKDKQIQQKAKLIQQKNTQIYTKTNQISILSQQIQHLKQSPITTTIKQQQQNQRQFKQLQRQKQHSIILQKEKQKSSIHTINHVQTQYCQTDPQLVLDIDFLRKTKLDITRRRQQMRQMKVSPQNMKHSNQNNYNNEYSSYKVISQTHKDAQGVQYKICLPPSLDVIAFDFQHSVSSSANMSPQRKFSNHNSNNKNNKSEQEQQSFYSNQRRIEEMYTIPKERQHHHKKQQINHQQIRHNTNLVHVESDKNKYMSQPTIPLEFSHSNGDSNGMDNQQQSKQSSSQQSDRIRVTPESGVEMMLVEQNINNRQDDISNHQQRDHSKKRTQQPQHHHQPPAHQLKQLHGMKPKVASYSQKNIIIQQMNEDDQHHQLTGIQQQYNQLQKIHKHSSHDHYNSNKQHQHKINCVNVAHHYHHGHGHHHTQQKQALNSNNSNNGNHHFKVRQANTLNDIDLLTKQQQHPHLIPNPNPSNLQQRRSDQLIPSRSALTQSSSASSIRQISPPQCHEIQDQKMFDMNYFDDDAIIDENLQNSDHPSETYKNSLRFPNGYCSGSMDKIPHKQHNQYHQSNQLSKSIGYDLHHDTNTKKRKPFNTDIKNAKQLLQLKSPQIVMKSLIDKSFPIQKNPFKLSNQFINVAELLQEQKNDTSSQNKNKNIKNKVDYLTVVNKINKSSNPGSDSLINILIDSHQQNSDHVQISTSNHDTTKQKQSQQQKFIQNVKNNPPVTTNTTNKASNFKTPKKHKTIQLTESLDFESLKKIQTQNVVQKAQQNSNKNNTTKSKKKQKIIYLRR